VELNSAESTPETIEMVADSLTEIVATAVEALVFSATEKVAPLVKPGGVESASAYEELELL
jgi:hypothetical protein